MEMEKCEPPPAYPAQQPGVYPLLPQQQGYQPGFQQDPNLQQPVIMAQPQVVVQVGAQKLPSESVQITCSSCHKSISTRVEYKNSTKTHIIAGILCILGCWPCCLYPYCIDSCKSANHYCPSCNVYQGRDSN